MHRANHKLAALPLLEAHSQHEARPVTYGVQFQWHGTRHLPPSLQRQDMVQSGMLYGHRGNTKRLACSEVIAIDIEEGVPQQFGCAWTSELIDLPLFVFFKSTFVGQTWILHARKSPPRTSQLTAAEKHIRGVRDEPLKLEVLSNNRPTDQPLTMLYLEINWHVKPVHANDFFGPTCFPTPLNVPCRSVCFRRCRFQ